MLKRLVFMAFLTILVFGTSSIIIYSFERPVNPLVPNEFRGWQEIPAERDMHTSAFTDGKGHRKVFLSGSPIHYQDHKGEFQPIDTHLQMDLTGNSRYPITALQNTLAARFGLTAKTGVRLENQGYILEFSLAKAGNGKARIHESKLQYPNALPGCDLEYTVQPGQVKEELIFASTPRSSTVTFRVNAPGLHVGSQPDGSTRFISASGETVFEVQPSFMYEKENPNNTGTVTTRFYQRAGRLYCDLIMDQSWFRDPQRHYPVVVDPTVVTYTSSDIQKFLFNCPETYSSFTCRIQSTKDTYTTSYFKNLTTGQVYITGIKGFDKTYTVTPITGQVLLVCLGYHNATATITYGDANGNLFANTAIQNEFSTFITKATTVDDSFNISKAIELKCTQRVDYSFARISTSSEEGSLEQNPYLRITLEGSSTPLVNLESANSGFVTLSPGKYNISVRPKKRRSIAAIYWYNYTAEITFAERTSAYEKAITIGTNPGYIISTVRIPQNGNMQWQYQAQASLSTTNYTFTSVSSYPYIEIWQDTNRIYQKTFDLNNYYMIHGGSIISVQKEIDYKIKISRGLCSNYYYYLSFGGINVRTMLPKAAPTELSLIDANGQTIIGSHLKSDAVFKYVNNDGYGPRNGKIKVQKVGSSEVKEFALTEQQLTNNIVQLPYRIQDFGYRSGDQLTCTIDVWNGFELTTKSFTFYIDDTPPVIQQFSGVVQNNNDLIVTYQLADALPSFLQNATLSWRVNGQLVGSDSLALNGTSYTIPSLPVGIIDIILTVTDQVGLQTTQTINLSTYPGGADIPNATTVLGSLLETNQVWSGNIILCGNLVVPHGVTLQLNAGTRVYFTGKYSIIVQGKILINGTAENRVIIGDAAVWNGLRLESGDAGSVINYATIQRATAGLVLSETQLEINGSIFKQNDYGVHIIHCNPTFQSCVFQENILYGVKEDNGAAPTTINCRFVQNAHADYYEDVKAVISIESLNQIGSNHGNSKE